VSLALACAPANIRSAAAARKGSLSAAVQFHRTAFNTAIRIAGQTGYFHQDAYAGTCVSSVRLRLCIDIDPGARLHFEQARKFIPSLWPIMEKSRAPVQRKALRSPRFCLRKPASLSSAPRRTISKLEATLASISIC